MYRNQLVAAAVAAILALTSPTLLAAHDTDDAQAPAAEQARLALRDLWVEHVFWVRSYFVAAHSQDNDQRDQAASEVVSNAQALSASIAPFYGDEAAAALLDLLAGHWTAVRDFGLATFEDEDTARGAALDAITNNARSIAAFLASANPYLPEDAVMGLLSAHGAHHVQQVDQIDDDDWASEASTWADMRAHMLVIADAIAEALFKQFPEGPPA